MGEALSVPVARMGFPWAPERTTVLELAPSSGRELLNFGQARVWLQGGLAAAGVGLEWESVLGAVERGAYRVLQVFHGSRCLAVMIFELDTFGDPAKKTLSVIAAGGAGMYAWLRPVHAALGMIARREKCERVLVVGRPGWEKVLRDIGYSRVAVFMEFAVTERG